MSKNKLIIDLRRIKLSDKQSKDLHQAIHEVVTTQLDKLADSRGNKNKTAKKESDNVETTFAADSTTITANLNVKFFNVNPGKSELKAILNDEEQVIDRSGIISFSNVESGNIIVIQGKSLGITTVTIDISADPTQMNFSPGHFNDNFFIN